eukprot:scaffold7.g3661.t1
MLRSLGSRLLRQAASKASNQQQARQLSRSVFAAARAARVAVEDGASAATADPLTDQRGRALDQALKEINSRFGKNSIMKLGATSFGEVSTTPSGALTLDLALGGGWPKGRVVEIYGPESSGKTTLALHAMAEVQKRGGNVALIDAEHAFDPVFAKGRARQLPALHPPPRRALAAAYRLRQGGGGRAGGDSLIRSAAVDMVAIDSVAALVPRAEIEGEIGQVTVGAQARLMSAALRKIAGNAARHNCAVIFLNQLRQKVFFFVFLFSAAQAPPPSPPPLSKVGVIYGNPEVTSGGQALKYYASVRMEVRIKEKISAGQLGQVGIRVKAKCTKNKVAPPYKLAEFDILFGSGISANGCLLDAAEATDVVQKKGSWYYFGEQRLAQGRDKTLDVIKEDAELHRRAGARGPHERGGRGPGGHEGREGARERGARARAKIEAATRDAMAGKDINDIYDSSPIEESFAEGDGVTRDVVEQ